MPQDHHRYECGICSRSWIGPDDEACPFCEIEWLQEVIGDGEAKLAARLSRIAHDEVRDGRMRHDIGILLMAAVRKAAGRPVPSEVS